MNHLSIGTPPKPLLRGVSHLVASGLSFLAAFVLVAQARSERARLAAAVYGFALTALFAISAAYHRPNWNPRARAWMRRLDHSAIFLLIAGTYTPFCLLLEGDRGTWLLAVVWSGASLGILQSVFWVRAPKPLVALLCVALGWVVVPLLPDLRVAMGGWGLAWLAAGGVSYSLGAVVYAVKWPNPLPAVFGYHEVFHALVVAAAVFQLVAVARVLPALH